MRLYTLALIAMMTQVMGCTTYISMSNDMNVSAPSSPPKIILGQTASYWGTYTGLDKELIDNWRQTGLFKEILVTSNPVPPAQGTFIHTSCTISRASTDGALGGLIFGVGFLVTLGIIPAGFDREDHSCTSDFYQNGIRLDTSYSRYYYKRQGGSWVMALIYSSEQVISGGEVTAASNIVSTQLANLKKAYP